MIRLYAGLGIVSLVALAAWRYDYVLDKNKSLEDELEAIQAQLKQAAAAEATETRWQNESNQVNKDAQIQLDRLKTDLAAAGDTIDRLREQAELYANRVPKCAGAADTGEAAPASAVVLAKLLTSCEQRATQLAQAVDESRIAGLACERAYKSLK